MSTPANDGAVNSLKQMKRLLFEESWALKFSHTGV